MAEEAARIQPLHHGHHRTSKQPKLELPSPVGAAAKGKITAATARKKPRAARKTATKTPQDGMTPKPALAGRTWLAAV